MWKNWLNVILGLWVVLIPFLNFSLAWQRTVLIFTGFIIAVLGFWSFYDARSKNLNAAAGETDSPAFSRRQGGFERDEKFVPSYEPPRTAVGEQPKQPNSFDVLNRQSIGGQATDMPEKKIEI